MSKCNELGHDWRITAAHGWYQCDRVVGLKSSRRKVPRLGDLIHCHAVGYCPGCLRYRLEGYALVWCSTHFSTCQIEHFPVVSPTRAACGPSPSADQLSFWK